MNQIQIPQVGADLRYRHLKNCRHDKLFNHILFRENLGN